MLSEQDAHHKEAIRFLDEYDDFLLTTRWVLAETANAAGGSVYREIAADFLRSAEHEPSIIIVGDSDSLYQRGLELYAKRPDKHWSLTDCISFVVMKEREIAEALTGDHHFIQAGFRARFAER